MGNFENIYNMLNGAQKEAVDAIEGPMLVIAGPGTGKTQLLSARVANILTKTDTLPQNILCLTFTENGATNMRDRLSQFIGQAAYDVTISTYHGFGREIIGRFPGHFAAHNLETPIDELERHQILSKIIEDTSYASPIKQTRHHIGDLISTISEVKRALLTSEDLRKIATENIAFETAINPIIKEALSGFRPSSSIKNSLPVYQELIDRAKGRYVSDGTAELSTSEARPMLHTTCYMLQTSLAAAIAQAEETNKTTPLTAWKNTWLAKDEDNNFILAGRLENRRLSALADVLDTYQSKLAEHGFYDFDDMIISAIKKLEEHNDLRYTLQEQYLYVLLDEYQDTNAAQARLVELLCDNPVNEGRPNVMAVGDDDQAIYAFQGAEASNLLDFSHRYRDTKLINLTENYRSHPSILEVATNIASQIETRLQVGSSKKLSSAAKITSPTIKRIDYLSDVAQSSGIAQEIKKLVEQGVCPSHIAIIAPKHKYLEPIVPHLAHLNLPMRYEKREDILEAPVIKQLLNMSRLVLALKNDIETANSLWPEVLSYPFWGIPIRDIWQLSWQANQQKKSWAELLLDKPEFEKPALLFLSLAVSVESETCETILDQLIGSEPVATNDPKTPKITSPMREFYTSSEAQNKNLGIFYETISHLRVLRTKLREHQKTTGQPLTIKDLISFVEMYQASGIRMQSTSPYCQSTEAIQIMTAFKAKGLEFDHVFLLSCHDDVWGSTSRGTYNKLALPLNLRHIRHAGASNDERLRLLFVAITRARQGLYLNSYQSDYAGKQSKKLKYLDEQDQTCDVLPTSYKEIIKNSQDPPELETLELDWRHLHLAALEKTSLRELLADKLKNYQLSPTHLNKFLDTTYGGPETFLFDVLLRFPTAQSSSIQFGNAIHETLEWLQYQLNESGKLPVLDQTLQYFSAQLRRANLTPAQFSLEEERGQKALSVFLSQRSHIFKPGDKAETNFKREGVFVDNAHLTGKIDRLEIDKNTKTITVVDYKTGALRSAKDISKDKLQKYKRQLCFYKILIEGSHSFAGLKVDGGRLEFIEPDQNGKIISLEIKFSEKEMEETRQAISHVWSRIQALDFS